MASGREVTATAVSENDCADESNVSRAEAVKIPNPEEVEGSSSQDDDESVRPRAVMSVGRDAPYYKMDHKRRGQAIILVNDKFDDINLQPRTCAGHDTAIAKHAFEHLGFEVKEYRNLARRELLLTLHEVRSQDHQDSDCLVVVFMSHGNVSNNREFLCTRDFKVDTAELWKNFTADKCPSLAGKPKLFFIQACRGDNSDKGVKMKHPKGLKVQTDSLRNEEDYVIPLHSDMLMMWASYPGMFAFKSYQNDIKGSVFIHFLAKVLVQDGRTCDLFTLLLRVTREVATQYESYSPQTDLIHQNKQTPYMVSTLMRKLVFPVWTS